MNSLQSPMTAEEHDEMTDKVEEFRRNINRRTDVLHMTEDYGGCIILQRAEVPWDTEERNVSVNPFSHTTFWHITTTARLGLELQLQRDKEACFNSDGMFLCPGRIRRYTNPRTFVFNKIFRNGMHAVNDTLRCFDKKCPRRWEVNRVIRWCGCSVAKGMEDPRLGIDVNGCYYGLGAECTRRNVRVASDVGCHYNEDSHTDDEYWWSDEPNLGAVEARKKDPPLNERTAILGTFPKVYADRKYTAFTLLDLCTVTCVRLLMKSYAGRQAMYGQYYSQINWYVSLEYEQVRLDYEAEGHKRIEELVTIMSQHKYRNIMNLKSMSLICPCQESVMRFVNTCRCKIRENIKFPRSASCYFSRNTYGHRSDCPYLKKNI